MCREALVLRNVSFAYEDLPVLRNINLTINYLHDLQFRVGETEVQGNGAA